MIDANHIVEVLLVEDNDGDAELAIRSLKKNHLANNLLRLHDGEEALEYLFSENTQVFPKVVLLDLKMPKVSGIDVLKKLKSDELRRVIPVVVLTSSKEDSDIIESYKLGVNAYIVKPVDFEKFTEAMRDIGFFWVVLNSCTTSK